MSRLKINLGKSVLVPVGDVINLHELVEILGCSESALPLKYLGLPLGASFKDKTVWNPILEKMEQRLAGWKRLYLSRGARLLLLRALALACLLIFFLFSLFLLRWPRGWRNYKETFFAMVLVIIVNFT